jgi:HD-like signal output (HDOD) protein
MTAMRRIDQAHQQLRPHLIPIPEAELLRLRLQLESSDLDPRLFVRELEPYPQILERVIQLANSPLNGRSRTSFEPLQAVAWLGSRQLTAVLEQLPEELILRAG